jgi:hypothetical protein
MKRKADWMDVGFAILITLVVLVLVFSLTSCQTAKNLPRHNDKFPLAAAQYAHKKFPPIESHTADTLTNSDTLYQPGPAIDTTVYCDTLFVTKSVSVKCPPSKTIHDTVRIYATNWMIDGAATQELELKLETVNGKLETANRKLQTVNGKLQTVNSKLNWWRIACIITWCVIVVFLSFRLKKF